jgi:ribonucleotide reductase alpha subunit
MVLKNYVKGKEFDFDELGRSVQQTVRLLNKVIDINSYVTEKGRKGGLQQRAIAIGVQGLADTFYLLDYHFTSEEAKKLNKDIFETIYYNAIEASVKLCESGEYQPYDGFHGSPMSKGIFQFDFDGWDETEFSGLYDWTDLRNRVAKHGVCNSLFTAQMPVASSANITDSFEMTEAPTSNLFNRRVIGGEFLIINKYMVDDFKKIGLWSEALKNEIIMESGSIQNINFQKYLDPEDKHYQKKVKRIEYLIEKYRTIWEYKQKDLIDLAADRSIFIDQTQSMNIYMAAPTVSKLTSSMFYSWEKGLKTGSYYIRTKPISTGAKHLAVDIAQQQEVPKAEEPTIVAAKPSNSPFECFGCSA